MECWFVICAIILVVIYKVLDRLIRIPRIGNYRNRYIFITGCDSGFGNLLAKRLDQLGCHVFAGCLTEKAETELKKASSDRLHTVSLDVTNHESVRKAFDYVKSKLPQGKGLWGVLNNAGVIMKMGPPEWLYVEDYKKQCDVNLWGLIDVTVTFLPLVKLEKGRVVNTSSIAGRCTFPVNTSYCISKYGVEAFTDGLRRTLKVFDCSAILIEPGAHQTHLMSSENFSNNLEQGFKDAPQEVKEEYGEEYWKGMLNRVPALRLLKVSARITDVVDAYEHALLGQFPRARYVVGKDAKYICLPVQALPEWIGDWLQSKFYRNHPLPAALMKKKKH